MTDHNDTGATARPSLTEMQLEILEECAGIRSPRLWGAAVGACLESLRGYGFIERNGKVTSAGATAIINAYEPLKARLAEVERERDDIRSTLNAWFNTSNKLEPDISKLLLDGLNGYIRRSESGGMPFELADDLRAVIEDFCRLYVGELLTPYIEQAKSSAEARIAVLVRALSDTLAQYVSMALSGDCGFWDPEEEHHVIAARAALSKARGTAKPGAEE